MANATTYNFALLEKTGEWDSWESWPYPSQINDLGTIVGTIESGPFGYVEAVKWENQKVTRLPQPWGGEAHGINNSNTIVGTVISMDEGARGPAVWKDGVLKVLDTLYGPWGGHYGYSPSAWAYAINDSGIIVGRSHMPGGKDQATLWNGSDVVGLMGPDGQPVPAAIGINNSNDIIGNSGSGAIVWQNGIPRYLDMLPGGTGTSAADINDLGQIVGSTTIGGVAHATLWDGDEVVDLGPGRAVAINNAGLILGSSWIWQNGTRLDLRDLVDLPTYVLWFGALDVNDDGLIVGSASVDHPLYCCLAYSAVLTPVPEPKTLAFLIAGLGLVALRVGRQTAVRPDRGCRAGRPRRATATPG